MTTPQARMLQQQLDINDNDDHHSHTIAHKQLSHRARLKVDDDSNELPKAVGFCEENLEAAVEAVEQDKAFGADDFNDLPKAVDSCDERRRKGENLGAHVGSV